MLRTALTVVTLIGVGWIIYRLEKLMADFTALNDTVAGLGTALDEAVARIDADFQALRDQLGNDATDQTAVDAATAALAASVDRLRAIDPNPANPAPTDTPPAA